MPGRACCCLGTRCPRDEPVPAQRHGDAASRRLLPMPLLLSLRSLRVTRCQRPHCTKPAGGRCVACRIAIHGDE